MLTNSSCQAIANFQNTLEQLQQAVTGEKPDRNTLKILFVQAKESFRDQVMKLNIDDQDPQIGVRVQSFLTETHKQMRLLEIDLRFWQAAHQTETAQIRLTQLCDRLTTLINYCNAILD